MLKKIAIVVGVVFVLIGILGFVPGITSTHADGGKYLLGIFLIDGVENVIHILTGLVALAAGYTSEKSSRMFFLAFGAVYALVTIIGFVQGDTVLGIFDVNTADNFLHLALAAAFLGIGLTAKPDDSVAMTV